MKLFMKLVFAIGVVLYLSGITVYAQGKGQGHAVSGQRDHQVKPRTGEHANAAKPDKQAKEARKEARTDERIVERINRNPQLKAKVESLLPPGMTMEMAAMGFKNQGAFISALHVSKNLNIPFDQLKAKMTGQDGASLGKAIHELRPNLTEKQANAEAEKAERQMKAERTPTKRIT
jgi:hypothetical protein